MQTPSVVGLHTSATHSFSKQAARELEFIEGIGIKGDAHAGRTVQHLSRVKKDPTQPNYRQVHLLALELIESLRAQGFGVEPGSLGENVTTAGIDLLGLPAGTRLQLGDTAIVEVTGLRNPCGQLDQFETGLLGALIEKKPDGEIVRKAGIMGIVAGSGRVSVGDAITIDYPSEKIPLAVV